MFFHLLRNSSISLGNALQFFSTKSFKYFMFISALKSSIFAIIINSICDDHHPRRFPKVFTHSVCLPLGRHPHWIKLAWVTKRTSRGWLSGTSKAHEGNCGLWLISSGSSFTLKEATATSWRHLRGPRRGTCGGEQRPLTDIQQLSHQYLVATLESLLERRSSSPTLRALLFWLTSWLQPLERSQARITQLSSSQIPQPWKLCEVLNAYCGIKSLHLWSFEMQQ